MITLYGIPNCDAVKKARNWLTECGLNFDFHDYKKAGAEADKLNRWCEAAGWETILNRAGTTFKTLPDAQKANLDQASAIALMLDQPSMIKRPIVEHSKGLLVGFKLPDWEAAFTDN